MTMTTMMTSHRRWLAAARLEPVDRLPFWPKLNASYAPMQRPPFRDMDIDAIHEWIGSDRHTGIGGCVKSVRSNTAAEVHEADGVRTTVYSTPVGTLRSVAHWNDDSKSWHPVECPVKTAADVPVWAAWEEDETWELDPEQLDKARAKAAEIGEDAVRTNGLGTTPLMRWIQHIAGIENAHYLLMDAGDDVRALFDLMHRKNMARMEIICEHSAADFMYLGENTSTTLISPAQYRELCMPHVLDYAAIANAHDRIMVIHMCGYLKDLLPDLAALPVAAFEAFTSPPVGNTTFVDGRTQCPNKCLVGGTNATLWTYPAETIIEEIGAHMDALPHHRGLVVTSAGVMPPLASPETIKAVCDWVKHYPAKM